MYFFHYFFFISANERPSSQNLVLQGKPKDISLKWGKSTIIECSADSSSPVTYSWYKDGNAILLQGRYSIIGRGNLKIRYAREEDSGTYKCQAKAGGSTVEASAKLAVQGEHFYIALLRGT